MQCQLCHILLLRARRSAMSSSNLGCSSVLRRKRVLEKQQRIPCHVKNPLVASIAVIPYQRAPGSARKMGGPDGPGRKHKAYLLMRGANAPGPARATRKRLTRLEPEAAGSLHSLPVLRATWIGTLREHDNHIIRQDFTNRSEEKTELHSWHPMVPG